MLQLLEDFLKAHDYFIEKEVRRIDHNSCSDCTVPVLSFDEIKDKFFDEVMRSGAFRLQSCDAVLLLREQNELHLIEMKRIANTIECTVFLNQLFGVPAIHEAELVTAPNLLWSKFFDSLLVLLGLMGHFKIDDSFYSYFYNPQRLKIKTYLLSNFSAEQMVEINLAYQDGFYNPINKMISEYTGIIDCESFARKFAA